MVEQKQAPFRIGIPAVHSSTVGLGLNTLAYPYSCRGGLPMETYALNSINDVKSLVGLAQSDDEPIAVFDGDDECLIAMRPGVFERLLFDSDLLNHTDRESILF